MSLKTYHMSQFKGQLYLWLPSTHLPVRGQPAVLDVVLGRVCVVRVGPGRVAGSGQRHVAHAKSVIDPQDAQRTAQRVAPLDAN